MGAINFDQQDEIIERDYGAIVVATGFKPIDASAFDEYAYNQSRTSSPRWSSSA